MTLDIEIDEHARAGIEIAGHRFLVFTRFVVIATDERGIPYDVLLRFELLDGHFACTHLNVTPNAGESITLAGLRSIPVETLLRRAIQQYGRRIFIEIVLAVPGPPKVHDNPIQRGPARLGGPLGLPLPPRRKQRRGPDDDLELVALVYTLSDICGLPPTQGVAEHFRVPLGTARDLARRARERGLLVQEPIELSGQGAAGSTG